MKPDDLPAASHPAGSMDTATRVSTAPRRPRILIVDDDACTVQALGRMLEGTAALSFACSGAEALRIAREQPPDLVLLDAEMPGMNGFEVCHALKADPALAGAAVIFVTSHGEAAYEVEALGVGAADFIAKPPMAEQVLARVKARLPGSAAAAPVPEGATGAARCAARLLLVAGDDDWLHFGRVTLAPMVGQVQFARTGAEALATLAREPADLVVAALKLPDMDGFGLCRHIRADPRPGQAALLLVGPRADWRSEAHAFELGANDFIAQPFPPAVLQARVRNLLRQRRQAERAALRQRGAWHRLDDARVADLVAAAPEPWLAVDADGRVVLANAAAAACLAGTGTALGRPLAELQAGAGWPGEAARWSIGEGVNRLTALRLNAAEAPATAPCHEHRP